ARRTPRRRDLLHAQRGQDHRGKLASALQHRASAWIARLQAAGAGGLHPTIRAGGPATPTSDAARAGATTIIALTIKFDPSVGADQRSMPSPSSFGRVTGTAAPSPATNAVAVALVQPMGTSSGTFTIPGSSALKKSEAFLRNAWKAVPSLCAS